MSTITVEESMQRITSPTRSSHFFFMAILVLCLSRPMIIIAFPDINMDATVGVEIIPPLP